MPRVLHQPPAGIKQSAVYFDFGVFRNDEFNLKVCRIRRNYRQDFPNNFPANLLSMNGNLWNLERSTIRNYYVLKLTTKLVKKMFLWDTFWKLIKSMSILILLIKKVWWQKLIQCWCWHGSTFFFTNVTKSHRTWVRALGKYNSWWWNAIVGYRENLQSTAQSWSRASSFKIKIFSLPPKSQFLQTRNEWWS